MRSKKIRAARGPKPPNSENVKTYEDYLREAAKRDPVYRHYFDSKGRLKPWPPFFTVQDRKKLWQSEE